DSYSRAEVSEFETARRLLVARAKPISGDDRGVWFEKIEGMIKTVFPEQEIRSSKPGLSYKLFFYEVSLPDFTMEDLEVAARELGGTWVASLPEGVTSALTNVYEDRKDLLFEFIFDLGETYVTGIVKLRCAHFPRKY